MTLRAVPCDLRMANAYIAAHHRTHKPVRGGKLFIAVSDGARVVGVAVVGRASRNDPDDLLAVTRCCTNGTHNACSKLYGIARRVAGILGYRVKTFIGEHESGASLRAAGYKFDGMTRGGTWSRPSRPRVDNAPTEPKQRWSA